MKKFGKNIKVPFIFIQQKMTRTFFPNNLNFDEQCAFIKEWISSLKSNVLLINFINLHQNDYCNNGKDIADDVCGRWRRSLFVRKKSSWFIRQRFLLWLWILCAARRMDQKYPPFQAQKLAIEGTYIEVDIWKVEKGIICKEITWLIPQSFTWKWQMKM